MNNVIRNKLWNIELVVEDIKKFPQTYNTILGKLSSDGTCQFILRRKLNKLCKDGIVFKTTIPGTRFGKIIHYCMPKNYHIIVEGGRTGSDVYCFFNYKTISKFYIEVDKYFILENNEWIEKKKKVFFEGNVLKWI